MNLLENGSFRVYCTVYELSSNNMLLFDLLWTLQFFLLFLFLFILYHYFKETDYGLLCMKS